MRDYLRPSTDKSEALVATRHIPVKANSTSTLSGVRCCLQADSSLMDKPQCEVADFRLFAHVRCGELATDVTSVG